MSSTREKLLGLEIPQTRINSNKVSIIGVGQVGMACAYAIMNQQMVNELALSDVAAEKLKGEFMDLSEGMCFTNNVKIRADTDLKVTANSDVIIITAGCRQKPGESRLDLVQRNTDIYKGMIPTLVKHSPNTILFVVSNPVDVMTYVTWKLSGLPANKVVGSGTNLDSARFRYYISKKLDIAPTSCHGWIIGEHGDSSVPVWSGVSVGGVNLKTLNPQIGTSEDPENWNQIHTQIVNSAYEIIKAKGYTNWAIASSVREIVRSMLKNERRVYALSTNIGDWSESKTMGIEGDIFLSVPCVVGQEGVHMKLTQTLNSEEQAKLVNSAKSLSSVQSGIQF